LKTRDNINENIHQRFHTKSLRIRQLIGIFFCKKKKVLNVDVSLVEWNGDHFENNSLNSTDKIAIHFWNEKTHFSLIYPEVGDLWKERR